MGITDYGHRGVPNVFLTAPLPSKGSGTRRTSRTPTYDRLVEDYIAALDLGAQRARGEEDPGAAARRDADHLPVLLLLPDRGRRRTSGNVEVSAMGHYDITKAGFTGS